MAKSNKAPAPAALKAGPLPAPPAASPSPPASTKETYTYPQKVLIAVGISTAAILFSAFLFYIAHILVLCFAGMLLAVFLSAPSDLLVKYTRLNRAYALLIVLATLALVIFGGGYLLGRTIIDQSQQMVPAIRGALLQVKKDLQGRLPQPSTMPASTTMTGTVPELPTTMAADSTAGATTSTAPATAPAPAPHEWLAAKLIDISEAGSDFLFSEGFVRRAGTFAGGVVSSTFEIVADVAVVLAIGLFFAINPRLYSQGVVRLLPLSHRRRTAAIVSEVGTQLQWWFVGQLCSMASIGLLTFIGLKILGIQMAATLAILAGLMNFIPNFGPIIAAAPAVLIAFAPEAGTTSLRPALAGWTILIYIIIQLLEGWVVTPFFQQRAVEIPPALIILAQVIFALLLGPLGLVLATPLLAALLVIVRMVYVEDLLGDLPQPEK